MISTKRTTIASIKVAALTAAVFSIAAAPLVAFASVDITEVMYDAPGSDAGHEWIEVANTGSNDINLAGYKLFEGGTNHGITVAQGTSTLASGEVAILANNTQTFLQDFPKYTGTLFKSAFSLSNTGESIVLKDAKLGAVSSVSYLSSLGADGDGNSLHVSGGVWAPGAPNPGSVSPTAPLKAPAAATPAVKSSATKSAVKSSTASKSPATPFQMPALPQDNTLWTTALGLLSLITLGVGGALYVKNPKTAFTYSETTPTADEFEIQ